MAKLANSLPVLFLAILLAILLAACAPSGRQSTPANDMDTLPARQKPSIHWRKDFTLKYLNDPKVRQLVAVQHLGGWKARIMLYEKTVYRGLNVWTETLSTEGSIGLAGLGKQREGDDKTPIGDFGIITAFGIKANPGTALPWLAIDKNSYCCGDLFYNKMIDIKKQPHQCTGEHLAEYSPEYNYGLFLDYNRKAEPGKGSAIFFHCDGANPFTGGCIAVSEKKMVAILRALKPGARVVIDYLP